MSDEAALLRAIHAEPGGDTPRLVYADWLDEHGRHERAEVIRVQIELASWMMTRQPKSRRLWKRQDEILNTHKKQWTANLAPFDEEKICVEFVRGLPAMIGAGGAAPDDFAIINRLPSLRRLEVTHSTLSPDVLRGIAKLQSLDAFTIEYTPFDPSWLELLGSTPVLDIRQRSRSKH